MITIEASETPLDFAYCSVKRLPLSQIFLLQAVALQYGDHGTTNDTDRAVAILEEVRGDYRRRLRQYENLVVYPRLATDYNFVGRHDISMDIVEETLQHSRSLKVRWEASIYAYSAEVCANIAERERCDLLLRKVAEYVESVPKFGTDMIENYWLFDLFSLYVRLGMVVAAESLAAKMVGVQRVDALATLALHGQPDGQCNESLLATAMEHTSEHSKALVASLMIQNGQFGRAMAVLDKITQSTYLRYEPLLEMVVAMLQRRDASGALDLIERLLATPHAVSIDFEHIAQICALLHEDHGDMLHKVLDHIGMSVEMNTRKLTRLARMAKLVGFLAPYSRDRAESAVDHLIDSCMAGLDQGARKITDRIPVALHTLAIAIDKHGLEWPDSRREKFRHLLGRIPVPRRFEYADLFRPRIADEIAVA